MEAKQNKKNCRYHFLKKISMFLIKFRWILVEMFLWSTYHYHILINNHVILPLIVLKMAIAPKLLFMYFTDRVLHTYVVLIGKFEI